MAETGQIQMLGNRMDFDYSQGVTGYVLVLVRVLTGYWFLHAGWGKLMAAEPFNAAGWMANATAGSPVHGFLVWAANTPWMLEFTNLMIPAGEFLIGLGILVGALTRLAAFFGGFLMVFFYLGNADWGHGYVNGDLFGLLMFVIVGTLAAGRIYGLDAIIEKMEFVQQRPVLKYLLG
ncbi:DoxX family membrane protein [Haloferax sp. MBLA0076]|uniref:DoxX family membrane protein n=1 Tax=Haloferax litoreum TaxID=2666140 RepID=A0A6A8GBL9_9EURY|nr:MULTISPECIES: DoxX family protein [Haloferax]KAB1192193.1 DoxX family protein [Haloferax sp. CBA1148]MRX20644.1 DoxX family membrane protein [Haloferax litoreum]